MPEKLANPIAIIASNTANQDTRKNSVIAFIEMQNNGRQVIAPIHVNFEGRTNGEVVDVSLDASTYGKQTSIVELNQAIINHSNGRPEVFYVNKKEVQNLLTDPAGLAALKALPGKEANPGDGGFYVMNIADTESPVKSKSVS